MADGGTPPERFDHQVTMMPNERLNITPTEFLKKICLASLQSGGKQNGFTR
ncbi:hypothetical protein [Synechococcus sp. MIT S1220]|uniref:hypothetical protein n=1 Tax=Synechococcus sp. MIT S1220 TaxID=3082549 RepID=UPI0039B082AD